eukprot:7774188-Pyramimonas_sp.AAC.1
MSGPEVVQPFSLETSSQLCVQGCRAKDARPFPPVTSCQLWAQNAANSRWPGQSHLITLAN